MRYESYATSSGIASVLAADGLKGFRDVAAARREVFAGDLSRRLPEFLVLGRFWLDACGNLAVLNDVYVANETLTKVLPLTIAKVVFLEELKAVMPGLNWSASRGFPLPREDDACEECGEGWTLDNCDDVVQMRTISDGETRKIFHRLCYALNVEREETARHEELFLEVGLGDVNYDKIPNEYWRGEGPPWFLLRTPKGNIKIGHRKRVFHIEWTDLLPKVKGLLEADIHFKDEDVTKGERYIHAWSREKAVEYLTKIAAAAKIGTFKKPVP